MIDVIDIFGSWDYFVCLRSRVVYCVEGVVGLWDCGIVGFGERVERMERMESGGGI